MLLMLNYHKYRQVETSISISLFLKKNTSVIQRLKFINQ